MSFGGTGGSSFTFGAPASTGTTFGQPTSTAAPSLFGGQPTTTSLGSMFGGFGATSTVGASPFSNIGNTNTMTTTTTSALPSFGSFQTSSTPFTAFGGTQSTQSSGVGFGTIQSTQPSIGVGFGGIQSSQPAATGFCTTTTSATPSFGFGATATAGSTTAGSFGQAPPLTTSAPSFGFGAKPTVAITQTTSTTSFFSQPAPLQTPAFSSVFSSSSSTTSAPCTTATVAGDSKLPKVAQTTSTGIPLLTSAPTTATSTTTTSTTSSITGVTDGSKMNFRQLEDAINKWNSELEEQERIFLSQATQVNAWDRLLIANGEKITALNEAVEQIQLNQQTLGHELDFILGQKRELEDLLAPLEQSVESLPALSIQQHADLERERTYHLVESIDCQLKRMAEDIKEVIQHLNTSTSQQDESDPVYQIAKILNAHMDALQWLDQNTATLQQKLDEVSKAYDSQKKDQDKTFLYSY